MTRFVGRLFDIGPFFCPVVFFVLLNFLRTQGLLNYFSLFRNRNARSQVDLNENSKSYFWISLSVDLLKLCHGFDFDLLKICHVPRYKFGN